MLAEMAELIDGTQMTVNGLTLGENIRVAKNYNDNVILGRSNPLIERDGLAVLHGDLTPGGAVIKPPAIEPRLLRHTGPAIVFLDYNDMAAWSPGNA
jgi:dihydroxyacid dehydratase/phosphogluconate dehydratase